MKKTWTTPGGEYYNHIKHMADQDRLLIAGQCGSGKSVLINTIIHTLLLESPATTEFILIDPKRTELSFYKNLPHTIGYAADHDKIINLLQEAVNIMDQRHKEMERKGLRTYDGKDLYIIFDEFGDLMTTNKKAVEPLIIRLAQLSRAARIHLILATQNPSRQVITASIKVNLTASVALRCREPIESRMIIGRKGAETLPKHGYGYYCSPDFTEPKLVPIPYTTDEEIKERVKWWTDQNKLSIFSLFARH